MNRLHRYLTQSRTLGLLVVIAAAIWLGGRGLPDRRLHVYFLDVGQGDATLVRTPDGRQILIDGGPFPEALLDELGDLMPLWDRSLDLVILTHPDGDHMNGLLTLPDRYAIRQAADAAGQDAATEWTMMLANATVPHTSLAPGTVLRAGNVRLEVLGAPGAPDKTQNSDNRGSLVLRLDYGATSLLLMGDAPQEAEQALLAAGAPLDADILKVGHHGSRSSTSPAFVAAVSPRVAVIQVGAENKYGHPDPAVLDRLRGVEVLRTDQNGRIEVMSDGERLWLRSQIRPPSD